MTHPLTIAMLCIHSSPIGILGTRKTGGMSVYVRALAREMGRAGHAVDIFTHGRPAGESAVTPLATNVRLITLDVGPHRPVGKGGLDRYADEYEGAIEIFRSGTRRAYDLIHSHYWISGQVGRILAKRWGRPHVISFHTLAALKARTGTGDPEPARRLQAEATLVRDSDALLVACPREKDNLTRFYAAVPDRIMQVPGGVDFERFRPRDRAAARRQLDFDLRNFILLSIGRLTPLKGQARIIEALALLGEDERLKLVIVGGDGPQDPEQQRLQKIAARFGVGTQVIFTGSIPHRELPAYYAAADVYVQASHYESFGLVGLEALACGRPVVSSPVGIMATLGRRPQPGCILTDGRPAALAAGIKALRSNAVTPPAAIRATVREFNWTQAAATALEAYRHVIRRHPLVVATSVRDTRRRMPHPGHQDRRRRADLDKQRVKPKL